MQRIMEVKPEVLTELERRTLRWTNFKGTECELDFAVPDGPVLAEVQATFEQLLATYRNTELRRRRREAIKDNAPEIDLDGIDEGQKALEANVGRFWEDVALEFALEIREGGEVAHGDRDAVRAELTTWARRYRQIRAALVARCFGAQGEAWGDDSEPVYAVGS